MCDADSVAGNDHVISNFLSDTSLNSKAVRKCVSVTPVLDSVDHAVLFSKAMTSEKGFTEIRQNYVATDTFCMIHNRTGS